MASRVTSRPVRPTRLVLALKRSAYIVMLCVAMMAGGLLAVVDGVRAQEPKALWAALKSRQAFVILRHALAPGTGDPGNFTIDDCQTQRNLSDAGREQARKIGDMFRANGISKASVHSSQWCRCRETARLMKLGAVEDLPELNSFFQDMGKREGQTAALKAWLQSNRSTAPLVLVSHQVNISALTGTPTRSGAAVFARIGAGGKVDVLGVID